MDSAASVRFQCSQALISQLARCVLRDLDAGVALDTGVMASLAAAEKLGSRQDSAEDGADRSADSLPEAATSGNNVAGSTLASQVDRVPVRDVV